MTIILDGTAGITTPELDSSGPVAGTTGTFSGAVSGTTGSFSGNLSFNSGYGSAAVAYGCRAWVNFNGTGTVAIREDGNVSSITDNGTGDYTVNFTTAMPDANYAVNVSLEVESGVGAPNARFGGITFGTVASGSVGVYTGYYTTSNVYTDMPSVFVSIFR